MTRTFTLSATTPTNIHLDLERELNPAQAAAVTSGPGPKLVIAGAGSGKTRTITYRVAYLLSKGLQPSQILLVTFTNKAAREMLSRVEVLIGATQTSIWGGTFHAIGNRLLRQYGNLIGLQPNYSILDAQDARDLVKVSVNESRIKVEEKRFPAPSVVQDIISFAANTRRSIAHVVGERSPHFAEWTEDLERVAGRYQQKKRAANALDYDDLLLNWLKLVSDNPEAAQRLGTQFQYILVDEYQDTNAIQSEIVERIAAHNGRNLMVVGDDAQSIYRFRGAHYDNIFKFPDRNPGTEVFKLEVNYRSTPEILDFTNASILKNQNQFQKSLTSNRSRGSLPIVLPVNDVYQEAAFVAERILQLREDGIPLKEMAVLYRAHSHSSIVQAELMKRNLPYEVRSGVRFFEMAHVKDVVAYLKVLENPWDEMAWRRLWLMLPRVGMATAAKLWESIEKTVDPLEVVLSDDYAKKVPAAAQAHMKRFQIDLRMLKSLSTDREPMSLIQAITETAYVEYLKTAYEGFAQRLEDLQQLAVFARSYRTLRSFLSELVLMGEMYGQDVEPGSMDDEKLILSSIHQAKGLEWRVVFILRMCEGQFPSEMGLREQDGEEEERRIFYVAATRAKDELYLTHPLIDMSMRGGGLMLQPSRFLREIRFTLYEQGQVETRYERDAWSDRD